ncbi:MAG: hypothetical protein HYZ26_03805 [Chloroflexi bacterium]|nr:hypothetical protein [Chloroflexota bacterium]
MKVYEHASFKGARGGPLARGPLAALKKRLPEILPDFASRLSDEFILLVNYPLAGTDIHIPLILTGPPGIHVISPLDLRGSYRARDMDWLVYNIDKRAFVPARQNLVARAVAYAVAVRKYLDERGLSVQVVEPVMLFTDPTISVDTARPRARVVIRAGIQQYVYSLSATPALLNQERLLLVNTTLARGRTPTLPRPATGSLNPPSRPRPASTEIETKPLGPRGVTLGWLLVGGLVLLLLIAAAILLALVAF